MNIIKTLSYLMVAGAMACTFTGCTDPDAEITSENYARLFRPVDVTLKVKEKVNITASMYFVTVPRYLDVNIQKCDDPASTDPQYVDYSKQAIDLYYTMKLATAIANETITETEWPYGSVPVPEAGFDYPEWPDVKTKLDAMALPSTSHQTMLVPFNALSYDKLYKFGFSTRDESGKTSLAAEQTITTDGIFKVLHDDGRWSDALTVKWLSNITVTRIVIKKVTDNGETDVEDRTLSATEIANCKAHFESLEANTNYNIYIYNGTDRQGKLSATTYPLYQELKPSDGKDVSTAVSELPDGYALMLSPDDDGTNTFDGGSMISVTKSLNILARDVKPVLVDKLCFEINGAGLTVSNIAVQNSGLDKTFMKVTKLAEGSSLIFNGVKMSGYKNFAYAAPSATGTCKLLQLKNCYIHDGMNGASDKRFMDFRGSTVENLDLEQNTFANLCSTSSFLRFDYVTSTSMPSVKTATVTNNSFYKVLASEKGIAYIRSSDAESTDFKCNISKNIFENCKNADGVYFSEDSKTNGLSFANNYYWNSPALLTPFATGQKAYDSKPTEYSSTAFKDVDKGDFTIKNETMVNNEIGNTEFSLTTED